MNTHDNQTHESTLGHSDLADPILARPFGSPSARKASCSFAPSRGKLVAAIAVFMAPLYAILFVPPSVAAQTPQMKFSFEDTGTTTADTVAGVVLNLVNTNGAATDLHGGPGTGVAGIGRALDFTSSLAGNTGANCLASTANNSTINFGTISSFTVTMWVKPTGNMNFARLFCLGANGTSDNGAANTLGFQGNGGTSANSVQATVNAANTTVSGLSNIVNNQWNFLAYTYDGTTIRVYSANETNPVVSGGSVANGGGNVNIGSSFSLWIGNRLSNRQRGFPAYFDDVRFYTGAADAGFLESVRLEAVTPPDPYAGGTIISPATTVYAGTQVTLSAAAHSTNPIIAYQWQTDGGMGTWTDLPGSTTNTYAIDTTGMSPGAYQFRLVVTNSLKNYFIGDPSTMILNPASGPLLTMDTTITPANALQTASVSMSAGFVGTMPLYYQWQFTDTNGVGPVDIPGATNSTYVITNVDFADAGTYRLVASNTVAGGSTAPSSFSSLMVRTPVYVFDAGSNNPTPSSYDIYQLSASGGSSAPDGFTTYTDADSPLSGQTFTTLSIPAGYELSEVYYRMLLNGHAASRTYIVRLYLVSGNLATFISAYTNSFTTPTIPGNGNWIRMTGLYNVLSPDTTYAYSIAFSGAGGQPLANASGNPYPGGQLLKIPTAGGAMTPGGTGTSDATFLLHLVPVGYPDIKSVSISPANSPSSPVYGGSPVALSVQATSSDASAFHYVWQTDNGLGGAFSDISNSDTNHYSFDTTSFSSGTYRYQVVVNNAQGSSTSSVVTLNLTAASAPVLANDTTLTPPAVFVGGSVQMSAVFNGTLPISYQWMFDNGGGAVPLNNATNATYTIPSAALGDNGSYFVIASNRIAPYTQSSTPAALTVASAPQVNTGSAGVFDAGGSAPSPGTYDIYQLGSLLPTIISNVNYYVDASAPPGQTFTTGNSAPDGYTLDSVYVQEELSTAGGSPSGTNVQAYTLGIYSVSGNGAVLLTSYVSTNALGIIEGNWIQFAGLTNILQASTTYAFSVRRNTTGWWKLANTQNFIDPGNPGNDAYLGGQCGVFPASGAGAITFTSDQYVDAAFLVSLSLASPPTVNTTPTNIVSSVSGNTLTLTWPEDHTGWTLQTNAVGVAASGAWFDFPAATGSRDVHQAIVTIDRSKANVYFRLIYNP